MTSFNVQPAPTATVGAHSEISSTQVNIQLGDRSYPILIGPGLIDKPSTWANLPKAACAMVVSNVTVAPLYSVRLKNAIATRFASVLEVVLPDGEDHKTWQTLNRIFDELLATGCDRKTVLFALGGGVVGDMTGFAAACYMRGVPFVQVPTTLLAQVDSSVGGKTAINHPQGKNMIGAFYQPLQVVCDLQTLQTLPARELSAGLAEVIKYGPIADMSFLAWLEDNLDALLQRDPEALAFAVKRSCEIKAWVVAQDERDFGLRAILNFGHTFGHAIETGLGYGQWLHGEAVGCGMLMAAHLSHRMGLIEHGMVVRLTSLLLRAGLPIKGPTLIEAARSAGPESESNARQYLALMRHDKKAEAGEIKFVLIDGPGKAVVKPAPDSLVIEVINDCCR